MLDQVDRKLINRLQTRFPLSPRPFQEIGRAMDISEEEVIRRLSRLKEIGVIRRIGANMSPKGLGYTSTLCAAQVEQEQVERFVESVNRYPGVTHNYLRDHKYNVWFTFIGPSMEYIRTLLEEIKNETGVTEILNMPARKVFKLRAEFKV